MDNLALKEREAYLAWLDYQLLERMSRRLQRLPARQPIIDSLTLKRLKAPRNTRAGVLAERAKATENQVRHSAVRLALQCFEELNRLQNAAGRSLDILSASGRPRRLILDEAFVVTKPTSSWMSSSRYELRGADIEDNWRPVVVRSDSNDDIVDFTP